MTREEILREVNRKLYILETTIEQPDEKILFLRDYLANNAFNRLELLINVNQADTMKAYMAATTSLDLSEISPIISDFIALFDSSDIEDTDLIELLAVATEQIITRYAKLYKEQERRKLCQSFKEQA